MLNRIRPRSGWLYLLAVLLLAATLGLFVKSVFASNQPGSAIHATSRLAVPLLTNTPTATRTSTFTSTRTPTITNSPTITNTPTRTNTPTNTRTSTSTATVTSTSTGTPTNTNTPAGTATNTGAATDTPTATPTQPVLLDVDVAPANAMPGGTLVLSYTVFSPNTQNVSLGAGLRNSECGGFFGDPAHDRTLTIPPGTSVITRLFSLPNTTNVTYDVLWGFWSEGFVTQYGLQQRNNAVTVSGPTATPSAPYILDTSLEPSIAYRGSTIVLTYTMYSSIAQQVGLGADMAPEGTTAFTSDAPNDRVVAVIAGSNVVTRSFNLGTRQPGYYTVRWGLFNASFTTQYDLKQRPGVLNIWEVGTGTPAISPTPRNTPTLTQTIGPCTTPLPPTSTPINTTTDTPTNTPTATPTDTPTNTPSNTPSVTPTSTPTYTETNTPTITLTRTLTNTPTVTPTNTPTSTNTSTNTPTLTFTITPSRTPTSTPTVTLTPTPYLTYTPVPGPALIGHVNWQGRPTQPNALQILPITLTLKSGTTEVNYPVQNTDPSGFFTVSVGSLADGVYTWRVKGPKYLANSGAVNIAGAQTTSVEMGQMRAGDTTNDNVINVNDFNILRGAFGKQVGESGYDDRAEFTGDNAINIADFNLQRGNFGFTGAPPP